MRYPAVFCLLASAVLATACDSTDFTIDPILWTDTVEIAVPDAGNQALPTALDVTVLGAGVRGGAFPERASQATEWDFALRRRDGGLALVPAAVLGLQNRSSITRALQNETFPGLIEAPGRSAFLSDTAVVLQPGSVYAARSRLIAGLYGGSCEQYSKLQPLEVDPVLGRVRLLITTNERCADPRLAIED